MNTRKQSLFMLVGCFPGVTVQLVSGQRGSVLLGSFLLSSVAAAQTKSLVVGIVSGDGEGSFADSDVGAFIWLSLQPNTIAAPNAADLSLDGITDLEDWSIVNGTNPSIGAAIVATLATGTSVPELAGSVRLAIAPALTQRSWRDVPRKQT